MRIAGTRRGRGARFVLATAIWLAACPQCANAADFHRLPRLSAAQRRAVRAARPVPEHRASERQSRRRLRRAPKATDAAVAAAGGKPRRAAVTMPAPIVPAGQVALAVSARFGRDLPAITGGLHWRIYPDRAGHAGAFRARQGGQGAAPDLRAAARRLRGQCRLRARERRPRRCNCAPRRCAKCSRFRPAACASKAGSAMPAFRRGRSRSISTRAASSRPATSGRSPPSIATGDVMLVPEGTYHIVSNYGDAQCHGALRHPRAGRQAHRRDRQPSRRRSSRSSW